MNVHTADLNLDHDLDSQICFALYDASRAMTRAYAPLLADLGLTYPQYLVMLVLWPSAVPLTVGQLGTELHLDSGTLTPLLKRLVQQGLVKRTRDTEDERRVLITLTARGRALRAQAADLPSRIAERCGISTTAARRLHKSLVALARTLAEPYEEVASAGSRGSSS